MGSRNVNLEDALRTRKHHLVGARTAEQMSTVWKQCRLTPRLSFLRLLQGRRSTVEAK